MALGRPITRNLGRVHVPPGSIPTTGAAGGNVTVSGTVYPNGATVRMGWVTRKDAEPWTPTPVSAEVASTPQGTWSTSVPLPATAGSYYLATWVRGWPRAVSYHGAPVVVT